MSLAPILVFAYDRPNHTQLMFDALSKNELASDSDLIVYSDGPKENASRETLQRINQTRQIILSQNWQKSLEYHFAEENIGCRDSIIRGITEVINKYGKVIVVEDDIITSPAFLTYMNKALSFYEDRKSVFSVSGHSHSPSKFKIPTDYDYDVFASPRLFNWGWGTWKDRWNQTDWTLSYYDDLLRHTYEINAFSRMGSDMMVMLKDEKEGRSSAWDIQFTFAHFANHAVSIVPCISYTKNIGLDGSGTHCYKSKTQETQINNNYNPRLLNNLYFDKRIINLLYSAFLNKRRPIWQKIINRIFRIIGKEPHYVIKGTVYS